MGSRQSLKIWIPGSPFSRGQASPGTRLRISVTGTGVPHPDGRPIAHRPRVSPAKAGAQPALDPDLRRENAITSFLVFPAQAGTQPFSTTTGFQISADALSGMTSWVDIERHRSPGAQRRKADWPPALVRGTSQRGCVAELKEAWVPRTATRPEDDNVWEQED